MKNLTKEKRFLSIVIISAMVTMTLATIMNSESAYAIGPKQERTFEIAPGHLKSSDEQSQSAKDFSPGQEAKIAGGTCSGCTGKDFAPGQVIKDIGT